VAHQVGFTSDAALASLVSGAAIESCRRDHPTSNLAKLTHGHGVSCHH
jgi:hypothetical protein